MLRDLTCLHGDLQLSYMIRFSAYTIILTLCVFCHVQVAGARPFKNTKGVIIEAELKGVDGSNVTIVRASDKREFTIPVSSLSSPDQEFIKNWISEKSTKSAPPMKVDEEVKAGAKFVIKFPDLVEDRKGGAAEMGVSIPSGYDPSKPIPLFVWMGGGDGGNNATTLGLVDGDKFVSAGLPFPKGMNASSQANMVGDYRKIWKEYHKPMLTALFKKIPNLDKRLCIIGGFSNGAHCIVGVLGEAPDGGYPEFFNCFIIVEGGAGFGAKRPKGGKGNYLFAAWGEGSTNAEQTETAAKKARGMIVEKYEMPDTGHTFSDGGKAKAKTWLNDVVIPATLGKSE